MRVANLAAITAVILAILTHLVNANSTPHTISFFVNPLPLERLSKVDKANDALLHPTDSILSNKLKAKTVDGLYSTYVGQLAFSSNGMINFPRKHQKPSFVFLVTDKAIKPVFMLANMVHHWEIDKRAHSKLYSVERKQDKETKLYYWDVTEIPAPKGRGLALNFITILVKDLDDIFIPTGITVANDSPQLVLPPIYVDPDAELPRVDMMVLNIRPYFSVVSKVFKKDKSRVSYKITSQ